jgi:hypothetical protein
MRRGIVRFVISDLAGVRFECTRIIALCIPGV